MIKGGSARTGIVPGHGRDAEVAPLTLNWHPTGNAILNAGTRRRVVVDAMPPLRELENVHVG
jgi:hypothetical protein